MSINKAQDWSDIDDRPEHLGYCSSWGKKPCVFCMMRFDNQCTYGFTSCPCLHMQGMYHVATLSLCETLDELGLSDVSSRLEVELGNYWDISDHDKRCAADQVELQVGWGIGFIEFMGNGHRCTCVTTEDQVTVLAAAGG